MKKIALHAFVGLLLTGAVSCTSQEYKKTKSGLLYKIISDKKNPVAKKGEFLKVHFVQKVRDSVLYSSEGGMPVYIQVDSARPVYSPTEVFPLLRKGDSAVVVELADTLQKRFGGQLPPFIHKKDKLTIAFKVLDVFPTLQAKTADQEKEQVGEKQREVSAVEGYLAQNNIKADKTEKGTYVVVNSAGDGPQVDSGKQVSVRYTGKLLPSGKEFESNMKGPGNEPFKFVVGQGQIIQGWDDGLRKFKKGGKGTLYIPAFLAYDQSPGPGHKPYENLIFDVEIVDVTDAPKPASTPAMPPMPMRPQQAQPHK
ncbi:MAG: FKBP-type peptidyl-prolyl cis-trans isomerase [Chitinophagaceae bacterium]|nr:FKBP-type peptidyl-prolyl cis-trans isomerase [Chitinophagaceae bacterium]